MERIVELTRQTFSKEFLRLMPKIREISEILWFVFKTGGFTHTNAISVRFPNFNEDSQGMIKAGLIEMNSDLVVLKEKFEEKLLSKDLRDITESDVTSILLDNYLDKLLDSFGMEEFVNSLSATLSGIIANSTPDQPAFMSKVLRTSANIIGELKLEGVLGNPRLVLDNYIFPLDLVEPFGNVGVALSEKAKQLIQMDNELSELYSSKKKDIKIKPVAKKEEKPVETEEPIRVKEEMEFV
ncbi:MAG: hypothetical protein HY051_00240 [Candidatus Aenigmarchaeota archaeon]|nr:hypothetical protein [Candidatus Aenigmarchaeota archaeon]